jgi:hypothetical protein
VTFVDSRQSELKAQRCCVICRVLERLRSENICLCVYSLSLSSACVVMWLCVRCVRVCMPRIGLPICIRSIGQGGE